MHIESDNPQVPCLPPMSPRSILPLAPASSVESLRSISPHARIGSAAVSDEEQCIGAILSKLSAPSYKAYKQPTDMVLRWDE